MSDKIMLEHIIDKIEAQNPLHAKKLRANLKTLDKTFFQWAEQFLEKYKTFLDKTGVGLDTAILYYLNKVNENIYEMVHFFKTGSYRYSSFSEVENRVYSNPEVMQSYLYGLLLSQVLWKQHFVVFDFFRQHLPKYSNAKSYLEVGGGHGLFINEAKHVIPQKSSFYMVDISETSLNVAKSFIGYPSVNYIHKNILDFSSAKKFDFISMGEVLEHVEDPGQLLLKLKELLAPNGTLFITTPTNAPDIDHIFLFNNTREIRELFADCGLSITAEKEVPTENITAEEAHRNKICVMYAAFLTIK